MGVNNSASDSTSSLGKHPTAPQSQEPKVSGGESGTLKPAATATTTATLQIEGHAKGAPGSDTMMMEVDPKTSAEGIKSIQDSDSSAPEQIQESDAAGGPSAESQSTSIRNADPALGASSTELETQRRASDSMGQLTSSDNQQLSTTTGKVDHSSTTATSSGDTQPKSEAPRSGIPAGPESSTPTTTLTVPTPQLVRTYIPQFKFTTFAPMTPLPTRNVTSNFLKTEKNFVLRNMARRRRRKRKAEDDTAQEEDNGAENKGEDQGEKEEKKEVANGALKRKKNDEFSAIRRGIFADEDDDDEDNEKDENVEDGNRKNEDEDEYEDSSDSDSEESVVNEMDENGEAKSVSHSPSR